MINADMIKDKAIFKKFQASSAGGSPFSKSVAAKQTILNQEIDFYKFNALIGGTLRFDFQKSSDLIQFYIYINDVLFKEFFTGVSQNYVDISFDAFSTIKITAQQKGTGSNAQLELQGSIVDDINKFIGEVNN